MSKSFVEKFAERMVDKVVDVENFELRDPYKKMAFGAAKTGYRKFKNSSAMKLIEKEPTIAIIKKALVGKVKTLKADELADESIVHNLYHVLGVAKDADLDGIKKAFKIAAMKYHPDKNPGNKANTVIFKKINQANEVLSNPAKRVLYDEFGDVSLRMGFDPEVARAGGYG